MLLLPVAAAAAAALLLLLLLHGAGATTPSGPPPGGRILPEATPVAPRGLMLPRINGSGHVITSPGTGRHWFSDPSPPVRDLNGTYHLFVARSVSAGAAGSVIVHFECSSAADLAAPSATWSGGEVVLSPNASGWDSGGVFSPGAAFDAINGTWSLYYAGAIKQAPFAWVGLASSSSPMPWNW